MSNVQHELHLPALHHDAAIADALAGGGVTVAFIAREPGARWVQVMVGRRVDPHDVARACSVALDTIAVGVAATDIDLPPFALSLFDRGELVLELVYAEPPALHGAVARAATLLEIDAEVIDDLVVRREREGDSQDEDDAVGWLFGRGRVRLGLLTSSEDEPRWEPLALPSPPAP